MDTSNSSLDQAFVRPFKLNYCNLFSAVFWSVKYKLEVNIFDFLESTIVGEFFNFAFSVLNLQHSNWQIWKFSLQS